MVAPTDGGQPPDTGSMTADELTPDERSELQRLRAEVVFGLVRRSTPNKVRAALAEFKPTVIRTSLTKDKEEELAAALRGE